MTISKEIRQYVDTPPFTLAYPYLTDKDALIHYCKHYGCKTVDDFKRILLWEEYWDLYKEEQGIRPRWTKWTDRSREEWEKAVEELY
jgi:hypothetical protein